MTHPIACSHSINFSREMLGKCISLSSLGNQIFSWKRVQCLPISDASVCILLKKHAALNFDSRQSLQGRETRGIEFKEGQSIRKKLEIERTSLHIALANRTSRPATRVHASASSEETKSSRESYAEREGNWISEQMRLQLINEGHPEGVAASIGSACAEGCRKFLALNEKQLDPLVLMDALEEEIERQGLRTDDFLPMELGHKGSKLLGARWAGPGRPSRYEQKVRENHLDLVDLSALPKGSFQVPPRKDAGAILEGEEDILDLT